MNELFNEELNTMARCFKTLGNENRLKILLFVMVEEECQCEIVSHLGLSQPAVARHMQLIVDAGLLKLRKKGNKRYYSLTEKAKKILFGELEKNGTYAIMHY